VTLDGPVPSIRLGTWVKTRKARTVDLSISPAAVALLRALPRIGYVLSGQQRITVLRDRLQAAQPR
jgi:hypothetical protein